MLNQVKCNFQIKISNLTKKKILGFETLNKQYWFKKRCHDTQNNDKEHNNTQHYGLNSDAQPKYCAVELIVTMINFVILCDVILSVKVPQNLNWVCPNFIWISLIKKFIFVQTYHTEKIYKHYSYLGVCIVALSIRTVA
jgi:hypothetical protein